MEEIINESPENVTLANITNGAVGVPKSEEKHWYVALVNPRSEKKCADALADAGYETYVATQRETHQWSQGRKKVIDRVVISSMVFVKTDEAGRHDILARKQYVIRFLTDRAKEKNQFGRAPIAIIPEAQMQMLRYMLGAAENPVMMESRHLVPGTRVKVLRGSLKGLTGTIQQLVTGDTMLYVALDILGSAKTLISPNDIEKL
ncbi:MAG: UpxY family transcription antiterminator [Prevotella sp.]|nr:UpxY family transcription antiterminator [Candidatus Prevotella equi]